MVTPMVKLLKQQQPDAVIDVVYMFDGVGYVYKNNPYVSKIYKLELFKQKKLKALWELRKVRKEKYDVSFMTLPAYRKEYHLVHFFAGAKKRVTHKFPTGRFSEFHILNTDLVWFDKKEHNVINNLNLLKAIGITWRQHLKRTAISYDFILDKQDITFGTSYIKDLEWEGKKIVGIHPGSTLSPAALLRRWPVKRYAEVINFLIEKKKARVLIFAGPDEKDLGQELLSLLKYPKHCHVVEKVNFGQAIGVLSQIDLLICNDNGFGHLAVGLNKKIITLWASTNDTWSLPYNPSLVTLIRPDHFTPWYQYDLKTEIPIGKTSGMHKISVGRVINNLIIQWPMSNGK